MPGTSRPRRATCRRSRSQRFRHGAHPPRLTSRLRRNCGSGSSRGAARLRRQAQASSRLPGERRSGNDQLVGLIAVPAELQSSPRRSGDAVVALPAVEAPVGKALWELHDGDFVHGREVTCQMPSALSEPNPDSEYSSAAVSLPPGADTGLTPVSTTTPSPLRSTSLKPQFLISVPFEGDEPAIPGKHHVIGALDPLGVDADRATRQRGDGEVIEVGCDDAGSASGTSNGLSRSSSPAPSTFRPACRRSGRDPDLALGLASVFATED